MKVIPGKKIRKKMPDFLTALMFYMSEKGKVKYPTSSHKYG